MGRPIYETHEDRSYENRSKQIVESTWRCKIHSNPKFYEIDWSITRKDKVVGFAEFKRRNYSYNALERLGGYKISLHKFVNLKMYNQTTGIPSSIIVSLHPCEIYYHLIDLACNYDVGIWGRKDRNDSEDIEPSVTIPMSKFKKVEAGGSFEE